MSARRMPTRNRSGRVPRAMTPKEVQAARPGLDFFSAVERSSRMRERQIGAFRRLFGEVPFQIDLAHNRKNTYFAIVHRETAQGPLQGHWRVTYFDDDGPMGHGYGSNYENKADPPGGYYGILRRLVREDAADLRMARFEG